VSTTLKWLQLHNYFVWRNNTGAVKTERRFIRYGHTGSADIIGLMPDGRLLAIECKKPAGPRGGISHAKQSDEQIEFQKSIEKNNGVYLLVRSLDDLTEGLRKARKP
jgi:hypothetical protein